MFGKIVGDGVLDVPQIKLSRIGKAIEKRIFLINMTYDDITIEKYVIMPNHIHLLVMVGNENANSAAMSIPSVVSTLKRFVNKDVGFNVWQRSYHDHVVRCERDYEEIWQYINDNPIRWESDCYY